MEQKTITYENCIVRIHIPGMTEEEKAKKQRKLKEATAHFLMQVEKERKKACTDI